MKKLLSKFSFVLKRGNILGALQSIYILSFSLISFSIYLFNIDVPHYVLVYLLSWFLISVFIYSNSKKLLKWTDSILIKFLDTYYGQAIILIFSAIEISVRENLRKDVENNTISYTLSFCILTIGAIVFAPIQLSIINQINFILFIIFFYWYRFRSSFFSKENFLKFTNISDNKELTWENTGILLFNSVLKKDYPNILIKDRLNHTRKRTIFESALISHLSKKVGDCLTQIDTNLSLRLGSLTAIVGMSLWTLEEHKKKGHQVNLLEKQLAHEMSMTKLKLANDLQFAREERIDKHLYEYYTSTLVKERADLISHKNSYFWTSVPKNVEEKLIVITKQLETYEKTYLNLDSSNKEISSGFITTSDTGSLDLLATTVNSF